MPGPLGPLRKRGPSLSKTPPRRAERRPQPRERMRHELKNVAPPGAPSPRVFAGVDSPGAPVPRDKGSGRTRRRHKNTGADARLDTTLACGCLKTESEIEQCARAGGRHARLPPPGTQPTPAAFFRGPLEPEFHTVALSIEPVVVALEPPASAVRARHLGATAAVLKYAPRRLRPDNGDDALVRAQSDADRWRERAFKAETRLRMLETRLKSLAARVRSG